MTTHAEKCKVIAEALGKFATLSPDKTVVLCSKAEDGDLGYFYNPLTNDGQNHELIRAFKLCITQTEWDEAAEVEWDNGEECIIAEDEDLNTAVFECAYRAVIAGWSLRHNKDGE